MILGLVEWSVHPIQAFLLAISLVCRGFENRVYRGFGSSKGSPRPNVINHDPECRNQRNNHQNFH